MLTASTPGAPLLARTFSHASKTRRLGISNDFTFDFDPTISSYPCGVTSGRSGPPGPFAPAPLQSLHRYYEPVRPCASHRYSAPCGFGHLGSSLSRPEPANRADIVRSSVSRRQVLLFHASARDELTPPIHRTPPGQHAARPLAQGPPAGGPLSRRYPQPPVSAPSFYVSMRPQWFIHVRLLVAYLTRCSGPFPQSLPTPALDRHDTAAV